MDIKQISAYFSVSSQIQPQDIKGLKDLGFKTIICNRPDNEEDGQPSFKEIKSEANKNGLKAIYIPIVAGQMTENDVSDFKTTLISQETPILAYCRSGARSSQLWTFSNSSP
jgi:sulfide:quinone oxidoreductase